MTPMVEWSLLNNEKNIPYIYNIILITCLCTTLYYSGKQKKKHPSAVEIKKIRENVEKREEKSVYNNIIIRILKK